MGGDDLAIFSGDRILFPGRKNLIYAFGAVSTPACFTFSPPLTLSEAIERSGGFSRNADLQNIQVYRILHANKQSIFHCRWDLEEKFKMAPWDIIYVPFQIPHDNSRSSLNLVLRRHLV